MTVFRFISLLMPFNSIKKLLIHEYLLVGSIALSVILIFQNQTENACLWSSILFCICFSSMYPLLLSTSLDYNLHLSSAQMTRTVIWTSLGEAVVVPLFGQLMEWFMHNILFYSIKDLSDGKKDSSYYSEEQLLESNYSEFKVKIISESFT